MYKKRMTLLLFPLTAFCKGSLQWILFCCITGLCLFFIPFVSLSAQETAPFFRAAHIDQVLSERGEVYIAVPLDKKKTGLSLADHISPDKLRNDTIFYYVSARDTALLFSSGIAFSVLPAPSLLNPVKMASTIPEVLAGTAYPTYPQYLEIMQTFGETYSEFLTIDTIGFSINNRLILAARIETSPLDQENKPCVFLSSTMHGDELPGFTILLMLIDSLTGQYNTSEKIRDLLDGITLIINPLANPDGTYFQSDTDVYGAKRFNSNNVDLNRNFPDPVVGDFPYGTARQPENIAMMEYMQKYRPSLSANIHAGAEVVNYPWDSRLDLHPDNTWFRFISKEYADTAREGYPQYMSQFPGGITNGAVWYIIYGGRQDYLTAFLQGRELTLEISDEKIPPASGLLYLWERNYTSLVNFIHQSHFGIRGIITDFETGDPLMARINLSGHDALNSYVYSDSLSGAFHRYVKEGNYRLIAEKQGYYSKLTELSIIDYGRVEIAISLKKKESTSPADEIKVYPNPFKREFMVDFFSETGGNTRAEIYSFTGQLVYSSQHDAIAGENTLFIMDIPVGIYLLKLTTPEYEFVRRIIRFPDN